ncbi:MAG TPA: hypothetical protein VJY85_10275 [Candidatus Limnocylindria bacterium]|nr:hypothetical protein [Candidatus Limnocylindria bacterium]
MNWKLDLNQGPKTIFEAQQEASMAQRVLNDAVFVDFLDQMQNAASNTALFDDKLETRDAARVKVLTIAELKARLLEAARRPVQDAEDEEQAAVHE